MRTIGIDLAVVGSHKAVILDDQGDAVGKVFQLRTDPGSLWTSSCVAVEPELLRTSRCGRSWSPPAWPGCRWSATSASGG